MICANMNHQIHALLQKTSKLASWWKHGLKLISDSQWHEISTEVAFSIKTTFLRSFRTTNGLTFNQILTQCDPMSKISTGDQNYCTVQCLTLLKWRIFSQPGKIETGKNTKSLYFLLGLKTCFESVNFSSNSCPELSNQVLTFSEGQIY